MKSINFLPLAVMLLLGAACSKPEDAPAAATETPATAVAADTGSGQGGAVSAPQPNGAVNGDANKSDPNITAASNSFTEGQAKGHIENSGYTDVTNLVKTADGIWTATAKKDGKSVNVALDFKGAVSVR